MAYTNACRHLQDNLEYGIFLYKLKKPINTQYKLLNGISNIKVVHNTNTYIYIYILHVKLIIQQQDAY